MLQLNIKIVDGVYIKSWEKDRKRKRRMLFSVFARKIDRRSIPVSGDLPEQPEPAGKDTGKISASRVCSRTGKIQRERRRLPHMAGY